MLARYVNFTYENIIDSVWITSASGEIPCFNFVNLWDYVIRSEPSVQITFWTYWTFFPDYTAFKLKMWFVCDRTYRMCNYRYTNVDFIPPPVGVNLCHYSQFGFAFVSHMIYMTLSGVHVTNTKLLLYLWKKNLYS